MKLSYLLILASMLLTACSKEEGVAGEDALNAWLRNQYPDGYEASSTGASVPSDPATDDDARRYNMTDAASLSPTVSITSSGGTDTGTSGGANATAICVGFGSTSNAWCIPADNEDVTVTDDSISLNMPVPPEICDGLSQICHDIKCYEFAQTSAGTFTASDVEYLAAACGKCDEPSCQDLISECDPAMAMFDCDMVADSLGSPSDYGASSTCTDSCYPSYVECIRSDCSEIMSMSDECMDFASSYDSDYFSSSEYRACFPCNYEYYDCLCDCEGVGEYCF